ncbi:MAG TPA: phosphate ABC transporter permease subunit PstC [Ruminiclostridium sp.]|nr:phosphate ABC transporter permease subunit PstC [Ruminiclostridium sp.]
MTKNKNSKFKMYYLKHEFAGKVIVTICGLFLIILTISLVAFIAEKGLATFFGNHLSPLQFLFSTQWGPDRGAAQGGPSIGALIFITGSILVSLFALLLSTPFSVAIAVFMTEISPVLGKKLLQPAIEVFVGIPSVVYGWVGLSVLVPFIRGAFGGLGFSLLAGSLVLAIMVFPTIASVSADAIRAIPRDYYEASLAIGATRWQTIRKVILPSAMPGILTGIVLGLARAFGEALAVQMVLGNTIRIPHSILDSTANMTSIITMDMGNTAAGTAWNNALWSMALLLLIMSFLFIVLIHRIGRKGVSK